MKLHIPKHHRTKKAKIGYLKRSAAAKQHHHRKRRHKLAWIHFLIIIALGTTLAYTGTVVAAMASNLIPPPSPPIDMARYEQAAREAREAAAQKAQQAPPPPDQSGVASWYALGLPQPDALTCASTKFPRGTYLQVTDLRNGKQVTCLVNDYGPQPHTNRVIDLSRGSYSALEGLGSGTMPVEIRVTPHP
mgnify:CR=1 FL=1